MLTSQQRAERDFWSQLVQSVGEEYYYAYRVAEYYEKTKHFPNFLSQKGDGLDYGCGCVSVFEGCARAVRACDPLIPEYVKIYNEEVHYPLMRLIYSTTPEGYDYSWIACINMIDHDPNPKLVLDDIWERLAPNGTLYFEVNLEAGLAAPHYSVWDASTPDQIFSPDYWQKQYCVIEPKPEHNQNRYWAEYRKRGTK